jgi:hypothetical protein
MLIECLTYAACRLRDKDFRNKNIGINSSCGFRRRTRHEIGEPFGQVIGVDRGAGGKTEMCSLRFRQTRIGIST